MFLLWAFMGFATVAYIVYEHGDISLVIQWMMMSGTSLVVVFQIYGYETFKATLSPHLRWAKAALATSCWVAGFIGWLVGALYLFRAKINPALPLALGSILPSVMGGLGFFPQIWEFHQLQTGEAYSSMLAFLDISGCIFGMSAWILQGSDTAGLIPYIVIICGQLGMLFLKHVWFACNVSAAKTNSVIGPPGPAKPLQMQPMSPVPMPVLQQPMMQGFYITGPLAMPQYGMPGPYGMPHMQAFHSI